MMSRLKPAIPESTASASPARTESHSSWRETFRTAAACLLLPLLLLACVPKAKYDALQTRLNDVSMHADEKENELRKAEAEIGRLEGELSARKQDVTDLQALYKELETEDRTLRDKNAVLLQEIDKLKAVQVVQEKVIHQIDSTWKQIETDLKDQIASKDVLIEEMEGKLKVTFVDKILFDSGSVRINSRGKEALGKLAESLAKDEKHRVVVEGHTDNVQIGPVLGKRFPSNWELSTARAAAVVRFLLESGNDLDPERFTASGFASFHPVSDNDSEQGRGKNRRIEILLVPEDE